MAINTTPKGKAAGGLHTTTATAINDLDFHTVDRPDQAFSTLRLAYASKGHALHLSDSADGPATFWAERWARRFLEQIGGRL